MLCLSREINETIVLTVGAKTITIRLNKIDPRRAGIGIEADLDVKILRGELVKPDRPPRRAA